MCELFGANLNVFSNDFQTHFPNPVTNEKIYILLDPCHMEKLVRNTLASRKTFYDQHDKKIEWKYIESLYNYSRTNDFRTHKINKKHIDWKRNAMNVRIAAQTFSLSVANSIEFLMNKNVPEFQGAEPTIKFIRRMDKLFNIFNSKRMNDKNIFKKSLSAENKRIIFDFLEDCIDFFKTIKVVNERIGKKRSTRGERVVLLLHSRNKCAFRGFIVDAHSLMAMYREYVEEKHFLSNIYTYNLLQDVIEMMFGRIRACGGFNNNPNVQQFIGAFRKMQCNIKIDLSVGSNCRMFDMNLPENLFYSDIFFVSSKRAKITMDEHAYREQKDLILKELSEISGFDTIDAYDPVDITDVLSHYALDGTSDFMVEYIASLIEKKIMQSGSFHCERCRLVFNENEKAITLNAFALNWQPCISTVDICKNSEIFFKLYNIQKSKPRFDFKVIYCLIFRSMNFNLLYTESKFECDLNHKYQFIKCVVGEIYINSSHTNFKANHIGWL